MIDALRNQFRSLYRASLELKTEAHEAHLAAAQAEVQLHELAIDLIQRTPGAKTLSDVFADDENMRKALALPMGC